MSEKLQVVEQAQGKVLIVMLVVLRFFSLTEGFWVVDFLVTLVLLVDLVILVLPKAGSAGLGLAVGRAERRGAIYVCGCQSVGRGVLGGLLSNLLGGRYWFIVCESS
jgi:hypothetical protein